MTENLAPKKKHVVREYAEALLTAVLLAFLIRSFVIEPYKIPSKSMVPTLLVGDHIFVNKFIYGWRIPGTKKWIFEWKEPHRGEVIVFIYPEDEKLDFIKRVVGLPGDTVGMKEGKLFVNGEEVPLSDLPILGVSRKDRRALRVEGIVPPGSLGKIPFSRGFENYNIGLEKLGEVDHLLQRSKRMPSLDEFEVVIPPGHFFVMGDNRDQSADSRVWGFVPRENLKGRAMFIWLSLDSELGGVRLKRFGKPII
ncbi:MAG: signal peptidase I [Deltaproteobacteria bacterium]|nr:signal peptidase I [Deltaproteobacteria bacterium]